MHPIGVFDSGVGGLSVLRALHAELPFEQFVYVADSGHAPYGERDDAHIITRSHAIANYLVQQHAIKALVVACNTATAAAIQHLRQRHPLLPIIGIEPALKPAAVLSKTGRIGVMATRGTLGSEKFNTLLNTLKDQADFVLQPCDGLADAIERDDASKIQSISRQCMHAMGSFGNAPGQIDTLVLGCTHYPFVQPLLQALAGQPIQCLEGGAPVARQTRRVLAERGQLATENLPLPLPPFNLQVFSTGNGATLIPSIQQWMHLNFAVHPITIT